MQESVVLENGKYEFVVIANGEFKCLHYGQKWRSLSGDKAVMSLFHEVQKLKQIITKNNLMIAELVNKKVQEGKIL